LLKLEIQNKMTSAVVNSKLNQKKLPSNWVPPKKPAYRESILKDSEIKAVLLNHNKQPYLDRNSTEK
jgi:hypothetical protein